MSITVEDSQILEKLSKDNHIKYLKIRIEIGRSAERLSTNSDWLRLKADIEKGLKEKEERKISIYDSILRNVSTTEGKLKAWDNIYASNLEIENFKYFISMVDKRIEDGQWAEKELEKLK